MQRLLVFTGIVLALQTSAFSEENAKQWPGEKTAPSSEVVSIPEWAKGSKVEPPANGRYQIFMSTILASHTFLVDTLTGKVWQLVKDKNGSLSWEQMIRD